MLLIMHALVRTLTRCRSVFISRQYAGGFSLEDAFVNEAECRVPVWLDASALKPSFAQQFPAAASSGRQGRLIGKARLLLLKLHGS